MEGLINGGRRRRRMMEEVVEERTGKRWSGAVRGGREQSLVNRGEQEKGRIMGTMYQQTPVPHPRIKNIPLLIHILTFT